ncbi:MAG: PAS domain S-box protein, partial [Chitinivibrionales bacterium]|nr:PAS domain S-box protein [Chitinivibrionales bacterium]
VPGRSFDFIVIFAIFVGAFLFITELRKRMKVRTQQLGREIDIRMEAEEKFKAIFDYANDGIILGDAGTKQLVMANDIICEMLGYTKEEITSLTVSDIHPEYSLPEVFESFEKQLRKEIRICENLPVQRKDGTVFYADINSSPVHLGGKDYLIGIFRDISERKRMQEDLKNTLDELSVIHQNAPVAMLLVDRERRVVKANKAAALFAYSTPEKMKGLRGGEALGCLHHLDDPRGCGFGPACENCTVRRAVLDTFDTGVDSHDIEAWLPFRSGDTPKKTCLLVSTSHVTIGRESAVLVCALDITDRKEAEKELGDYRKNLEQQVHRRTNQLRQERDTSQKYLDIVAVMVVGLDTEGTIVLLNKEAYTILGYAETELIGKNWFDIVLPDRLRDEVLGVFSGLVEGTVEPFEYHENPIVAKDGEERMILWHNSVLRNDNGAVTGTLHSGMDVTEQRKAQEALQESERRFRTVADYTYDWEYWLLPDKTFAYVSPSVRRVTGRQPDEFIKKPDLCIEVVHPDDREEFRQHVDNRHEYDVSELRFRITRCDGETRWIHHICRPMRTEEGECLGVRGSNRDITKEVLLERKETESRKMFRELAENIQEIFFLIDAARHTLIYISPAASLIIGDTFLKLPRDIADLTNLVIEEDRERLDIASDWFIQQERIDEEVRICRHDGAVAWLRVRTFPVRNENGAITRVAGIATDITMHKEIAEKERIHTEQLQQADKMASLGMLVSGVAHEINNPNNFIMLNSPILRQAWNDIKPILDRYCEENGEFKMGGIPYTRMSGRIPQLFDGIEKGAQRIRSIVADLKNYARKDISDFSGRIEVNRIAGEAISLMQSQISKCTGRFSFFSSDRVLYVRGNAQKLE